MCTNLPVPPATINLVEVGFVKASHGLLSLDDTFKVPFNVNVPRSQFVPHVRI